jgi:hypothetical protein
MVHYRLGRCHWGPDLHSAPSKPCHAPSVFQDGHAGEVDVWALGQLIREAFRFVVAFPPIITQVGEALRAGQLDIGTALGKIEEFRPRGRLLLGEV